MDSGTDYAAAVEACWSYGKVDLAWFGGFTFVQANVRSGGQLIPLVLTDRGPNFRSSSSPLPSSFINTLADLKGIRSVSGRSSTSGHLMPRSFLLQAARSGTYLPAPQLLGSQHATIAATVAAVK